MNSDIEHNATLDNCLTDLNREDFEAIYRQYWQRMYDFALSKTHDKDASEEIVQDLFVALWEKRNSLKIKNLQGYLFVSVRNRVINYYKEKIFIELDHVSNEVIAPDYPLFLDELETTLQTAIEKLPQKTHQIFLLNRFEGKSAKEISNQLAIPERTVEYHITQALRQLRLMLRNSIYIVLSYISDCII